MKVELILGNEKIAVSLMPETENERKILGIFCDDEYTIVVSRRYLNNNYYIDNKLQQIVLHLKKKEGVDDEEK